MFMRGLDIFCYQVELRVTMRVETGQQRRLAPMKDSS
jgi:hypothetical protein